MNVLRAVCTRLEICFFDLFAFPGVEIRDFLNARKYFDYDDVKTENCTYNQYFDFHKRQRIPKWDKLCNKMQSWDSNNRKN